MIESLFKESPSISNVGADEQEIAQADSACPHEAEENSVVSALSAMRKIVWRKTVFSRRAEDGGGGDDAAADLVQTIALRLWRWRDKFRYKSQEMSPDEWQSFAARTAYNELNRHFSAGALLKEVALEEALEIEARDLIEGDTNAEVASLARAVWQEICRLSLRQRRALLLQSQQLVVRFLDNGIGDEELMRALEFGEGEWAEVKIRLPLSDVQIARLAVEKGGGKKGKSVESLIKSVKKARYDARRRLQKFLARR